MENELSIELLNKLSIENLQLIKSEAEQNLEDLSRSEDIITNKSNTMFQVLVVIFTAIIGYLVSQFENFDLKSIIIQISLFFCLVFGVVLFLLIKVIYPKRVALKGAKPSSLVKDFVFNKKSDKNHCKQILRNRVYSLNLAIQSNKQNLNKRVLLFDWANKIVLIGLVVAVVYSFIYFFSMLSGSPLLST